MLLKFKLSNVCLIPALRSCPLRWFQTFPGCQRVEANQRWFDACVVPAKIMDIPLTRNQLTSISLNMRPEVHTLAKPRSFVSGKQVHRRYNPNDQTVQAQAERAAETAI